MARIGSFFLSVAMCMATQALWPQGVMDSPAVRSWAWDQLKTWPFRTRDTRGNLTWKKASFLDLPPEEQTSQLLSHLEGNPQERRAALVVLGTRPMGGWAPQALLRGPSRDEVALWLYRHGYREAGRDPFLYLEPSAQVERPWTQGLGLHLAGSSWRFQWIPAPALLPPKAGASALPAPLEAAPVPTALLRLKQLRPGLIRLQTLAGGKEGMMSVLAHGTRAGFLLRHLEPWLSHCPPGLEPLAEREAWVLHYGLSRGFGPSAGTMVFLPGGLPARTSFVLGLLKFNPTSAGARSRTDTWEDGRGGKARITQVRASGGVLHILSVPGGTWISDREEPLRAVAFPTPFPTLGERPEWSRVASAALGPRTEVSLWLLPRLGAGAAFERTLLRRRMLGLDQPTWPNPAIAKAAPRAGVLSATLGAGPTQALLQSILRLDREGVPALPALPDGPLTPTPEQRQAYEGDRATLAARRKDREGLHGDLTALQALLDLRGAAFLWNGWTAPPELTPTQRGTLSEFQKLRREDPGKASLLERKGTYGVYGGFLDPGLSPGLALALPVQAGKAAQAGEVMARLWPRLFKGSPQSRDYAKGVVLHRMVTGQALRPSYAFAAGTLVVATDDEAARTMLAGLLGQAPTLADLPAAAFGRMEVDGARAATELAFLLRAYLRTHRNNPYGWLGEPEPSYDDARGEVAAIFGPFLSALKALGRQGLNVELTPAGFVVQPR